VARVLAAALVVAVLAACGGSGPPQPLVGGDPTAAKKPIVPVSAQAVVGHMLGSIADRTIGPFLARIPGQGGVVAWVTPAEGSARRIIAVPLTAVGEPRGAPKTIANVGVDTTMLVVRPTRGAVPGVAVAWTVLTDRGEALYAVVVGEDGTPRGKAVELARTSDDVVWVDIVATDIGCVVVWTEETRGADANILAASLDVDGKVRGVPARIARGVAGWHALPLPTGVGVSTVVTPKGAKGGALSFQRLDADGHPASAPVSIVSLPLVSGDVEVVRAADRLVFAWTDRTTEDPSVVAAALGDDGRVEPPHKAVEARGGAALLGLAAGPAGTAMMWEAPVRRTSETRRVYAARIGAGLGIEGRPSSLEVVGRAAPEITATDVGFAVLAPLRDCEVGSPRCPDAAIVPTLVRTDAQLVAVQREPFGFGTDPASMAWGMTCDHDVCLALAASGTSPARVRAAEVRSRVNVKAPAAAALASSDGPKVTEVSAIATGESVSDIAATRMGDVTLLATLASKAEAFGTKAHGAPEDARNAPMTLSTRVVDAAGSVSAPSVITTRALAVGGVAVAPAEKPDDGAAVAWVARDNGDPEVHVTRLDKKGKKVNDLQLTTIKGDASDVAIAWAGNGWVVAWVDGRDGNGEVYATRVGTDLSRGNGVRITNAPGDASDLVALALGDRVWLAWADPRESPKDGMADVFVAAVRAKDAQRDLDEQRVLATAAHSRTPQLTASAEGGVNVAWIEEAPLGVESPDSSGYGAMWATVGASGKVAKPRKLPLGGDGAATSVALEANAGSLRAVVARSMADAIALDGIDLTAPEPRAFPLLTLDGPPSLDVALVLEGGALYFNDDGPAPSDKRARRARIAWSR
jgi:hypothetical protein